MISDLERKICFSQAIECNFWELLYGNPGGIDGFGAHFSLEIGEEWTTFISKTTDVLAYNRTYSRYGNALLTPAQLTHFVELYGSHGIPRFFLSLTPMEEERYQRIVEKAGFRRYNQWVKLYRSLDNFEMVDDDPRVNSISESDEMKFADVIRRGFDEPEQLNYLNASIPVMKGTYSYFGLKDKKPGAAATLFTKGEWALLVMAATEEWARGRGLQKALILARLNKAKQLGCKWICVETSDDKPEEPNISKANMVKMGFEVLFKRTNFIYEG